ncbi:MAG TPA: tripartite tricarboxylate transporter permease [Methanothrix sp.]|jgi:putative membrane protein|uniref:tripartite tricarboxylate transporter permease n=1 Tax=Methanothrix sp. TaxID=90426 RepID=UPI002C2B9DCA|nr:tripartite tricarboxylate transporter permease [Methanothrix sp.]MDI9417303.1 tripartite tricarboxylate transporter permease [Euryarchaeota archaeon]HON35946.1 tripartite tricarboxylate transporter permease [Methanothrix sp.]HRU75254.1 tripartite tricarboxylate transporter permease [Methanothrix sp.]
MLEFIDTTLAFCVILGFVLGIISGLTPGLHLNNFASMLLALSPQLILLGLTPFQMASIILAASISQTFFDAIPAIFLGAPDSETALSVLPGQRLMLEGRGIEAVRLSALGSAGSIAFSLFLIYPLSWIVSGYYEYFTKYVGIILLGIALMMIKSERGPWIEGQGSLVHWKYRLIAAMLFLTSGLLGLFAFEHDGLLSSPLNLEPQVLLPLLSGIFGASSLILSLSTKVQIPKQTESRIKMPAPSLIKAVLSGGLGGSLVAWIPGISPSVASIATRLGSPGTAEEFLVSIAGVNSANALFSLVALYVIDRPRSGAAAAIQELMTLDERTMAMMMVIVMMVVLASYLATVGTADIAARTISRLNYTQLCVFVLVFLLVMTYAFTGIFGLFILLLSTIVGLVAPVAGIHRTHAMGVLMLPLIVMYI